MIRKNKVAIACGGPSSEHEVSILSVKSILKNIDTEKYEVSVFYITKDLLSTSFIPQSKFFIPKNLKTFLPLYMGVQKWLTGCNVVLLAGIHGEFVEDGRLQCILDMFNIAYTGSGMAASVLAMDKYRSSIIVSSILNLSIPQTQYIDIYNPNFKINTFPVICKPNYMGSSIGIKISHSPEDINKYMKFIKDKFGQRYILIQEKITDAIEVSCGVLVDKQGSVTLLPPIEIIPHTSNFFDYNAKYKEGGSTEITPPLNINRKISKKISEYAAKIHTLLGCATYSRSDFFVKGNEIIYLETNTLPGMTGASLLPKEANAIGLSYSTLLDFLISNSL